LSAISGKSQAEPDAAFPVRNVMSVEFSLMPQPTLPAFRRTALLLDLDGTLLDFAPTPDGVVVPAHLPDDLRRLRDRLDGALGIITGRPVAQIDGLLPGIPTAISGEHGGVLRRAPGAAEEPTNLPGVPPDWLVQAEVLVAGFPGAMLESKRRGFVLHYRQAPSAGPVFAAALRTLLESQPGRFQLMPAAMAWEIRPVGADKGTALRAMMQRPPFRGRLPLFIGDDVTDEDAIAEATMLGGAGLRVEPVFGRPAGVRDWLARAAAGAEDGWPSP
jgi:trehalose 6-phosphate phosphatase